MKIFVELFILLSYFSTLTFQQHPLKSLQLLSQRGGRSLPLSLSWQKSGDPMICTEITVNHTFTDFSRDIFTFPNTTAFAKLKLFKDNNNNKTQDYFICVSDVKALDLTNNLTSSFTCYENVNKQCNFNISNPCNFDLNEFDPLTLFNAYFINSDGSYGDGIFVGYISNGSIIDVDGALFSLNDPCHSWNWQKGLQKVKQTTCCTKMHPAPKSPPAPRCKRFQSDLIFYNGDDTIFASSSMNYTLNGNQIVTQGNYTKVKSFPYPVYFFNVEKNCGSEEDTQLRCNISLPPRDTKIFIAMSYSEMSFRGFYDYMSPLRAAVVGSFILRNNQTLMYEGIPFTQQNACVTYNGHNYMNKPSICEFCCKEFE